MDKNQRTGVRFGMFPCEVMKEAEKHPHRRRNHLMPAKTLFGVYLQYVRMGHSFIFDIERVDGPYLAPIFFVPLGDRLLDFFFRGLNKFSRWVKILHLNRFLFRRESDIKGGITLTDLTSR
jgi:hypothetical protein